jgi:hypothetical protein
MLNHQPSAQEAAVLGQRYAYATASLVLGLVCFVNLASLEKAALAIVFGMMALGRRPAPVLEHRRAWAFAGISLGAAMLVLVPTVIYVFVGMDGLRLLGEALVRLEAGK